VLDGVESLSEKQRQIATRTNIRRERAASLQDGTVAEATPLQRLADIAVGLAIGFVLEDAPLYVDGDPADPAATPYERLEMAQLRRRVLALVDELPDMERRVIRHHYLQQIPFEQIARSRGLTKGRISQIHRAALERLRHLCTADGATIVT
jgi:RNA polymerase sigma factor for flagellar operon FliA